MNPRAKTLNPWEAMIVDECQKTLVAYHADTVSVINGLGVQGSTYDQVWLQINERLNAEIEPEGGKTDGALHTLGEFLQQIETAQLLLREGNVPGALMVSLEMARQAHQLRGRMILRQTTIEKKVANAKSVTARQKNAEKRKSEVIAFRATHHLLTKNDCWEKWKRLHPRKGVGHSTFFEYLREVT